MSITCQLIHEWCHRQKRFDFKAKGVIRENIPNNGIYFLFERGEKAYGGDRIVRIGTHTGKEKWNHKLSNRLNAHSIKENKDRSIFRKHIGMAFLNKEEDKFLPLWNIDLTTKENKERYQSKIDPARQKEVEGNVSQYIQKNISFVVKEVNDKEERLQLESKLIATISLCKECKPSEKWLGLHVPTKQEKIKESGLWNVRGLYDKNNLLLDEDIKHYFSY